MITSSQRIPIAAMVQICALLTSLAGCKRQVPVERAEGTQDGSETGSVTAEADRCHTSANALPIARLLMEWHEEGRAGNLLLGTEGIVRIQRAVVGRVSGPCILGLHGEVLLWVDGDLNVTGAQHNHLGTFRRHPEVHIHRDVVQVDEVLVSEDGVATAVDSKGAFYLLPTDRPAVSLPGSVKGDVSRARRTALLLWQMGHR